MLTLCTRCSWDEPVRVRYPGAPALRQISASGRRTANSKSESVEGPQNCVAGVVPRWLLTISYWRFRVCEERYQLIGFFGDVETAGSAGGVSEPSSHRSKRRGRRSLIWRS